MNELEIIREAQDTLDTESKEEKPIEFTESQLEENFLFNEKWENFAEGNLEGAELIEFIVESSNTGLLGLDKNGELQFQLETIDTYDYLYSIINKQKRAAHDSKYTNLIVEDEQDLILFKEGVTEIDFLEELHRYINEHRISLINQRIRLAESNLEIDAEILMLDKLQGTLHKNVEKFGIGNILRSSRKIHTARTSLKIAKVPTISQWIIKMLIIKHI
ncbi:MAG: hypothetical protein Q9M76_01890 [Candidatus Dojkabacteria bacterium]|nr:hypothetical protein [Candidatus Dojkabacteria bacterium]